MFGQIIYPYWAWYEMVACPWATLSICLFSSVSKGGGGGGGGRGVLTGTTNLLYLAPSSCCEILNWLVTASLEFQILGHVRHVRK